MENIEIARDKVGKEEGSSYSAKRRRTNQKFNEILTKLQCKKSAGKQIANFDLQSYTTSDSSDTDADTAKSTEKCNELSNDFSDEFESSVCSDDESLFRNDEIEEEEISAESTLSDQMTDWAICFSINLNALSALLRILKPFHSELPLDGRTLLNTQTTYDIKTFSDGGKYFHFGLRDIIVNLLKNCEKKSVNHIKLQVNIDGLQLFKSTSTQFWPILGLTSLNKSPFVIGLYCGTSKPSINEYLSDFIEEFKEIKKNKITYNSDIVDVSIDCFICDAPAKAYIKQIKGHNAYYGCDKCKQEGKYIKNRMTFPNTENPLRTDEEFCQMIDEDHHKDVTPLHEICDYLVTGCVIDYMHLLCLGVVKRMISFWMKGPIEKRIRLHNNDVRKISNHIVSLRHTLPSDFSRKPRSIFEVDRWKATEFRQLLLYTGPLVFKDVLEESIYKHFLLLFVGIHILMNDELNSSCNDYAEELLKLFVNKSVKLYGEEFPVYNVHGLVHLAAEAKRNGTLDKFSAFPFENYMKSLRKLVRKSELPLTQAIRRLSEISHKEKSPPLNQKICLRDEHNDGPLINSLVTLAQFKYLYYNNWHLSINPPNNCVSLTSGLPAVILNILKKENSISVLCKTFSQNKNFFIYPLPSSSINVYVSSNLDEKIILIELKDIKSKNVMLPITTSEHLIIPLCH